MMSIVSLKGWSFIKASCIESSAYVAEHPNTTSSIGIVETATGKVAKKIVLDKERYFSEGITILNDRIYHVTYKIRKGLYIK